VYHGRSHPGFNLFDADDEALFSAIARREFNISDMQNKTLRRFVSEKNSGQVSRLLKRLRVHGLIKKGGHTYRYYLTRFGKSAIATGLKLRELVIIPQLALNSAV
jgi:DNA-binding HxlR family transcriptional regulator